MLEFKQLSAQIGDKQIINNITFNVIPHQITALIGSNGSGKSTLISQLLYPNKSITIDGQPYLKSNQISILMQSPNIPDHFRVIDLLMYNRLASTSLFRRPQANDFEQIENCLKKCDCLQFKNSYFKNLSGGEKQRVLIAGSIVTNPQYLILDEPTNHLDIKYQTHVLNLIKQLNTIDHITVLIVLHDINQALKLADNIVCLKAGTVLFDKQPTAITTSDLSTAFEIEFKQHGDRVFIPIIK